MDREAAEEAANLPGIVMIVVGALNLIGYLISTFFSVFGIIFGGIAGVLAGLASLAGLADVFSSGDIAAIVTGLAGLFSAVVSPLITICNGCNNVVFLLASGLVVFGGLKLRSLEAPGTVRMATTAMIAGPVIALTIALVGVLASVAPAMVTALVNVNIGGAIGALFGGCCGTVGPLISNGIWLVINGAIAFWVRSTLANEDVAAAMTE